jgi:hypothetical protein
MSKFESDITVAAIGTQDTFTGDIAHNLLRPSLLYRFLPKIDQTMAEVGSVDHLGTIDLPITAFIIISCC